MRVLLSVITAFIMMPFLAQASDVEAPQELKTAPQTEIATLNTQQPQQGDFLLEGYVVKTFQCPPCPENARCKPCMRNNVIFSENNQPVDSYSAMTDKEIVVFTQEVEKLELGKRYNISVTILDSKTTGTLTNDIELLSFTPLDE